MTTSTSIKISPNLIPKETSNGIKYYECKITGENILPNQELPTNYRVSKSLDFNSLSEDQKEVLLSYLAKTDFLIQEKIDGHRCTIFNGIAWSSSGRKIRNQALQRKVSTGLYDGLDGELVARSGSFRETQSLVTSERGDLSELVFIVFDRMHGTDNLKTRWDNFIKDYHSGKTNWDKDFLKIVKHDCKTTIYTKHQLELKLKNVTGICMEDNSEGFVLKPLHLPYTYGRASLSNPYSIKFKLVSDTEARILTVIEGTSNLNPPKDEQGGLTSRGTKAEFMIPNGLAASMYVVGENHTPFAGLTFNISLGSLTEFERKKLLEDYESDPDKFKGKRVTFKYFGFGDYNLPRSPIFKGFR